MDRESDNFTAEMLLKELGAERARPRHDRRRRDGRDADARRGGRADDRRAHRRRLRALAARPADRRMRSAACCRRMWNDPVVRPALLVGAAGRGRERHAAAPDAQAAGARASCCAKTGTTTTRRRSPATSATATPSRSLQNGHPLSYWWARRAQDRFAQVLAARSSSSEVRLGQAAAPRPSAPSSASSCRAPRRRSARSSSPTPSSPTFAPCASSAAAASSRVNASSVPVITYVLPVSGPSTGLSSSPISKRRPSARSSSTSARFASSANHSAIASARSGPIPSTSRISSCVAVEQPVDVLEVAREVLRRHPADVGDVQAEQHAVERHLLRRLDRLDRVRRRDLAVALELHQLLLRQPVELRQRADEARVPEPAHRLLADALDVRGRLHPVDQRLEPARRTGAVRAAVHRLALRLDDRPRRRAGTSSAS